MMQILPMRCFSGSRKSGLWLSIAALVVLVLLVLAFWYRRFLLSGLDLVAEATGSRATAALCVAVVLLVLGLLLFWMIFPILVYFGLKNLSRRTAELDGTMKVCAQLLAKAAAERPAAANLDDTSVRSAPDTKAP